MRLRSLWSLRPHLAGLPLRDVIPLQNITYMQTLNPNFNQESLNQPLINQNQQITQNQNTQTIF